MNKRNLAQMSSWTPQSEPRKTQGQAFVSSEDYTTNVNTCAKCAAREAKERAERAVKVVLDLSKKAGFKNIQQPDLIAQDDKEKWICLEVKGKQLFTPDRNFHYEGIGLDQRQLYLRTKLRELLGWPTYLINYVEETNDIYVGNLAELDRGIHYDTTKADIRIYPISSFKKLEPTLNALELIFRGLKDVR